MGNTGLQTKKRIFALLVIFTLLTGLLLSRVIWLQFVRGEELQKKAAEQQNKGRIINARRGSICDTNGKELAVSGSVETVSVNPQDIKRKYKGDLNDLAGKLAAILDMERQKVYKKLTMNSGYEIIKGKVEKETGDKVRKLVSDQEIPGISVDEDSKRYYPNGNLAAHVIGFTGSDNQGLDGIEKMMEEYLRGKPGKILSEVDARGNQLPFNSEKYVSPEDGLNVILTIDWTIQYLAEKALEKAIEDNNVLEGAVAIVTDPRDGDILALVSKPDYDLNNPYAAPAGTDPAAWNGHTDNDVNILRKTVWRDKAISDSFEPGSTFKAITASAGLEENVVTPDTPVVCAPVKVGGWTINCWKSPPHGAEIFKEGVYNSCNPVFVKLSQILGVNRFYSYVRSFGFYDKTRIQLPGEADSIFHKTPTEVDMAAASFGQRFQITPIQLIMAYGAIANGGNLYKPRLVKELTDSSGNAVKRFEPQIVRTAISKQTSDTVRQILEGVVSTGTGSNAYVKGYKVAGKTGTSETKDTPKTGRYITSFMAFAPADNPVVCVYIMLDHPSGYSHFGGVIAAPVAGKLIEEIMNYMHIEPNYTEKDEEMIVHEAIVPEVRGMNLKDAKKALSGLKLDYKVEGAGSDTEETIVVEQTPKPDMNLPEKSVVILYTYKPETEKMVTVPDVVNKTVFEAAEVLSNAGLNLRISGLGTAIRQEIKPGAQVPEGSSIQVEFRNLDTED